MKRKYDKSMTCLWCLNRSRSLCIFERVDYSSEEELMHEEEANDEWYEGREEELKVGRKRGCVIVGETESEFDDSGVDVWAEEKCSASRLLPEQRRQSAVTELRRSKRRKTRTQGR